jgi:hypothetical protein
MAGLARDWVPLVHDAMGGNYSSDYGSLICLSTIYLRVPPSRIASSAGIYFLLTKAHFSTLPTNYHCCLDRFWSWLLLRGQIKALLIAYIIPLGTHLAFLGAASSLWEAKLCLYCLALRRHVGVDALFDEWSCD